MIMNIAYCKGDYEFPEDVERLVQVIYEKGYIISPMEAENAWQDYSNDIDAGWIVLPDSSENIWEMISPWLGFLTIK